MAGLATVPAYGENHGWDIRPSPEPTVTSCEQEHPLPWRLRSLGWCGWKVIPIGILMDPTRDLSDVARQQSLHGRRHHGSAGFLNQVQSSGDPGSLQCMADQDPGLCVPIITRKVYPTCALRKRLGFSETTKQRPLCWREPANFGNF